MHLNLGKKMKIWPPLPLIKKSKFWILDFLIFPPFGLFPLFGTFFVWDSSLREIRDPRGPYVSVYKLYTWIFNVKINNKRTPFFKGLSYPRKHIYYHSYSMRLDCKIRYFSPMHVKNQPFVLNIEWVAPFFAK